MYSYQGAGSGGAVKALLVFAGLLLIAVFIAGTIFADSYWGNPPQGQALADRIQIENGGLEAQQQADAEKQRIENKALEDQQEAEAERLRIENRTLEEQWEIDSQALKQKSEDESRARQERASRTLLWQDRWNEFGMGLAAVVVAGLLVIGGVRLVIPAVAQARERLQQRAIELETRQAERLREERRLEQVRLEWARVTLAPEQVRGNGRERNVSLERPMMPSPSASALSAPSSN